MHRFFFLYRTAWRQWVKPSIPNALFVLTAEKYSLTPHFTWKTACRIVKKVKVVVTDGRKRTYFMTTCHSFLLPTDWNELFTTKCVSCGFPIEAGDRWVEALDNNYHSQCFNCTVMKKHVIIIVIYFWLRIIANIFFSYAKIIWRA